MLCREFSLIFHLFVIKITPKNKKYIEKNIVAPKTDDRNQINKLDIPPFIVANKVNENDVFHIRYNEW